MAHEIRQQNYHTDKGHGRYVGFRSMVAPQRENELLELIDIANHHGVKSYLEIGLERGITFHAIASRLPKGSRCVGVDKPFDALGTGGPELIGSVCADLIARGQYPTIVWGDSADPEVVKTVHNLGPYDLILIDGDHLLDGVTKDWENYGPHGKMVAFHDIVYDWEDAKVYELWDKLKIQHPAKYLEILGAPSVPRAGMGIGLLFRK